MFQTLLTGLGNVSAAMKAVPLADHAVIDDLDLAFADPDLPRLAAPEIGEILVRASVDHIANDDVRRVVLDGMRRAAEKRVAGVVAAKRRRHYRHAAELVAGCVACDKGSDSAQWLAALRTEYRRYPALRAELDRALVSR